MNLPWDQQMHRTNDFTDKRNARIKIKENETHTRRVYQSATRVMSARVENEGYGRHICNKPTDAALNHYGRRTRPESSPGVRNKDRWSIQDKRTPVSDLLKKIINEGGRGSVHAVGCVQRIIDLNAEMNA
jgi:hypothetical protein